MKIKEFFIQSYRVLRNLTLPFEENSEKFSETTYKLDLIVGVNGTGKSTLLRALAELFQRLDSNNRLPPFGFRIKYQLDEQNSGHPLSITISNLDEDKQKCLQSDQDVKNERRLYLYVEQEQKMLREELSDRIDTKYLPLRVVAFSSGSEKEWELTDAHLESIDASIQPFSAKNDPGFEKELRELFSEEQAQVQERDDKVVTNEERTIEKRFIFIKNQQLPLVILCGLLVDMHESPNRPNEKGQLTEALKETKIKGLRGFSLKYSVNPTGNIAEDEKTFLQQLSNEATYTVQTGAEHLLVFNLQQEQHTDASLLERVINIQGNGLQLFRRLAELAYPEEGEEPVIREINLFLERDYTRKYKAEEAVEQTEELPPLHLLNWLSDGETSFLGRLCLLSLLRETEALVLLDEPEVHFNDYWKRQLVQMLDQCLDGQYSHVLMTTHSSITLSDVDNTNIWVLKRNGSFTCYADTPSLRTLGTDPSDIIIHIFGAESATGAQSVAYLQRKIGEILARDTTEAKRQELEELLKRVGPSPWRFLIRRELYALEDVQR